MKHGTHRLALETTLLADEELADPLYAGIIELARTLADELDSPAPQTRTVATYAGLLNGLSRIVRDARDLRRKTGVSPAKSSSRLTFIRNQRAQEAS